VNFSLSTSFNTLHLSCVVADVSALNTESMHVGMPQSCAPHRSNNWQSRTKSNWSENPERSLEFMDLHIAEGYTKPLQASPLERDYTKQHGKCTLEGTERHVNVSIIHYTYGQDFDEHGKHTYGYVGPWHWDKRDYGRYYPDLPIVRPAAGTPDTVFKLIEAVEEAGFSDWLWDWWRANMAEVKDGN
jgi:hypothetical protein